MIADVEGRVRRNTDLGRGNVLLDVEAGPIPSRCRPGQFVMVAAEDGNPHPFPLLRRALAVYSLPDPKGERLTLLLKVVGPGTRRLARLRQGDQVRLTGPLGNGFHVDEGGGRLALILAGGIGIASVFLLARALRDQGHDVHLIYGARTAADLVCLGDFEDLGISVVTTTEDGSHGLAGRITEGLHRYLPRISPEGSVVYTCGPNAMMQAVARQLTDLSVPCQISVETRMACGFGVCLGCSVKVGDRYRLACTQGPVFEASEFVWPAA